MATRSPRRGRGHKAGTKHSADRRRITRVQRRRSPGSRTTAPVGISALGFKILSTLPLLASAAREQVETSYAEWSGTSMATPHVTAAAALVIARDPTLAPPQVADRLKSTATKVPAMKHKAFTREFGSGLLNVRAAVS